VLAGRLSISAEIENDEDESTEQIEKRNMADFIVLKLLISFPLVTLVRQCDTLFAQRLDKDIEIHAGDTVVVRKVDVLDVDKRCQLVHPNRYAVSSKK
jgi:hypothetical protein